MKWLEWKFHIVKLSIELYTDYVLSEPVEVQIGTNNDAS